MSSLFNAHVLLPLIKRARRRSGRPFPLAQLVPADIQRILVISSTAIGDTLLSTPAIHALRRRYPRAQLMGLLHRRVVPLFRQYDELNEIIPLRRSLVLTAWHLRRARPEVAVILHGNEPEAAMLAYLSGARYIVMHPRRHLLPELLSPFAGAKAYDPLTEHSIIARLRLAGLLGADTGETTMRLPVPPETEQRAAELLRRHGVGAGDVCIGFQVGAATRYKMWPATSFMLLAHRLLRANPQLKILLLGSAQEASLCAEIKSGVRDHTSAIINLAGGIDLPVLPALVKGLSLLVTNDTGAMHVAIAVKTPTVSLFAPTDPTGVGPIQDTERHCVIKQPPTCTPCVTKRCRTPFCMDQITVEEVWQAVLSHPVFRGMNGNTVSLS